MEKPAIISTIAAAMATLAIASGCSTSSGTPYMFDGGTVAISGSTATIMLENGADSSEETWTFHVNGNTIECNSIEKDDSFILTMNGTGDAGRSEISFNHGLDNFLISINTDDMGRVVSTEVLKDDILVGASLGNATMEHDGFDSIDLTVYGTSAQGDRYALRRTAMGTQAAHSIVTQGIGEQPDEETQTAMNEYGSSEYMQLVKTMKDSGVRAWDGFAKTNSKILDGSSFILDIVFVDGAAIHASGTNAYPDGYRDLCSEIISMCC